MAQLVIAHRERGSAKGSVILFGALVHLLSLNNYHGLALRVASARHIVPAGMLTSPFFMA